MFLISISNSHIHLYPSIQATLSSLFSSFQDILTASLFPDHWFEMNMLLFSTIPTLFSHVVPHLRGATKQFIAEGSNSPSNQQDQILWNKYFRLSLLFIQMKQLDIGEWSATKRNIFLNRYKIYRTYYYSYYSYHPYHHW